MLRDRLKALRRGDALLLVPALAIPALVIGLATGLPRKLWLANGLPVPVTVEIDGVRTDIEPMDRTSVRVQGPVHRARVLGASGAVLDEGPFGVPAGDFAAYNALGAAPLLTVTVHYSAGGDQAPDVTFFGGQRVAAERVVDFLFTDPPHSLSVKQGQSATRTVVMEPKGGYRATMSYLADHGDRRRAAEVGQAVALAAPEDDDVLATALRATEAASGFAAAIGFAREVLARRPDDFEAHREYQHLMRRADRLDEVRAEYRVRLERHPGSVEAAMLLARVEPAAEGRARYAEILAAHPEEARAVLSAAWSAHVTGDHATAVTLFSRFGDHPHYVRYLREHALSLVALGRTPEALALLARALEKEGPNQAWWATLYHQLARRPDAGTLAAPPLAFVEKLAVKPGAGSVVALALSLVGESRGEVKADKRSDEVAAQLVEIQIAAATDPRAAWKLCAKAPPAVLERLFPAVAVLLAAEFARAGDQDLAERLLLGHSEITAPPAAILAYARTGVEHPDLWRLDLEERAALSLVRARALEASGKSGAPLYDAAEQGDLAQGLVTRARRSWTPLGTPVAAAKPKPRPGR